jgi:hypothetical protein
MTFILLNAMVEDKKELRTRKERVDNRGKSKQGMLAVVALDSLVKLRREE